MIRQRLAISVISAGVFFSPLVFAPTASKEKTAKEQTGAFDPHDLSGKWNRVSPFQTYRNVEWSKN